MWKFTAMLFLAALFTGCYFYYPAGGNGNGSGGKTISEGYIGSAIPDNKFYGYAEKKGVNVSRKEYAQPGINAKGDTCRRFADFYYPTGTPKGIMAIFHGGGFDVGFADFKSQAERAISLTERGYIAVSCEYRRGWTEAQFNGEERDVFNATSAEYARLETAARLAIDDARDAIAFIRKEEGTSLPLYVEGTSAGGSIVLYLLAVDPAFRKAQGIAGGLCGYGGVSVDDPIKSVDVPLVLIGGIEDTRVPFYSGWYFGADGKSEEGIGIGRVYEQLSAKNDPVCLLATCNAGHTWGAIEESETHDIFFDLVESHKAGSADLPAEVWYVKNHNNGTRSEVQKCN